MSILSELKKLTGKKANVISKALPDEFGGSGDDNVEYVNLTCIETGTETSPFVWHADKTYAEILQLFDEGKEIRFVDKTHGRVSLAPACQTRTISPSFEAYFFNGIFIGDSISDPKKIVKFTLFTISENDTITEEKVSIVGT